MLMTLYFYPVLRVPESGGQRCCEVWGDDKSLCHTLAFIQMISKVGQDWTVVRIVTISLMWCTLLTHGNFKGRHLSWKSCQVWTRSFLSVFVSRCKYIGCWSWYTRTEWDKQSSFYLEPYNGQDIVVFIVADTLYHVPMYPQCHPHHYQCCKS